MQQNFRSCGYEFVVPTDKYKIAVDNCLDTWPSLRKDEGLSASYITIYRCTEPTCTATLDVRKSGSGFLIRHSIHNHKNRFGRRLVWSALPSSSSSSGGASNHPFPQHSATGLVVGDNGEVEEIIYDERPESRNEKLPPHVLFVRDDDLRAKLAEQHNVKLPPSGLVFLASLKDVGKVQRCKSPALGYDSDMLDITDREAIVYVTLPTSVIAPPPKVTRSRSRKSAKAVSTASSVSAASTVMDTTTTTTLPPPPTPSTAVQCNILEGQASSVMAGIMQASIKMLVNSWNCMAGFLVGFF